MNHSRKKSTTTTSTRHIKRRCIICRDLWIFLSIRSPESGISFDYQITNQSSWLKTMKWQFIGWLIVLHVCVAIKLRKKKFVLRRKIQKKHEIITTNYEVGQNSRVNIVVFALSPARQHSLLWLVDFFMQLTRFLSLLTLDLPLGFGWPWTNFERGRKVCYVQFLLSRSPTTHMYPTEVSLCVKNKLFFFLSVYIHWKSLNCQEFFWVTLVARESGVE